MRANRNGNGRVSADTLPTSPELSSPNLDTDIAELRSMGVEALRIRWAQRFRSTAPPIQSPDVLMRLYAWRVQVESYGELDDETKRLLARARTHLD